MERQVSRVREGPAFLSLHMCRRYVGRNGTAIGNAIVLLMAN